MKFYLSILLLFLGMSAFSAFGQDSSVRGVVKDTTGALVAGATVTLDCRNSEIQTTTTDAAGEFEFVARAAGCSLSVRRSGFAPFEKELASAADDALRIVLEINETRVTVTAETGRSEALERVPQSVTLIGRERIIEKNVGVLGQAADEEAGVSFQKTSPTIGAIAIRGLTGKNVSVYVDGVRYTNSAQRGGINTFFNLNDPSDIQTVEILRGANSAQYGSDSLGGTINLISRTPNFSSDRNEFNGEFLIGGATADRSFGGSAYLSFGTSRLGGYANLTARRINTLRSADSLDSHAAVTRFLGLPSDILGKRLTDTAFTQYAGAFRLNYSPRADQTVVFKYQRSQQDGGKRYDQLLGGDGNLIADLRNLMLDFGYVRFIKQDFFGFDAASFTTSFNSQREERVNQGGQGNPTGTVTHQYERTSATGLSFFLAKEMPFRNSFLLGGDYYFEKINAPAYTYNPVNNTTVLSRPRVPDEARFITSGLYVQNAWEAIPNRLRISGAFRYNVGSYKARAGASPVVNNARLWNDDSLRVADFSGRLGTVVRIAEGFNLSFNYARGFRYPSMTDLGTLGLTGDGFEVDYVSAIGLGGTIGSDASSNAVSTGVSVSRQRSEYTNTFDFGARYASRRFETNLTAFYTQLKETITKQALILPPGSVGRLLGDQPIVSQTPNGTVFVAASTAPVLVRANFTSARLYGFEYEFRLRLTEPLSLKGNYTFIHSEDSVTGLPPNIEGGTPPPQGFLGLRYDLNSRMWFEFFSTFADRQDRLSTLDLSDRRTGATRTRAQIQNYFRRGACVQGLTNNPDGRCGTGDETILLSTGETLTQVQNRVLGVGVDSAPLFTYLPGFALFNLRGGFRFGEKSTIYWSFENMLDQFHRKPSWGIDGAGRSFKIQYRFKF